MKKIIVLSYDRVTISDCRKMSRAGAEIKVDADNKTVTIDTGNITYMGKWSSRPRRPKCFGTFI